MTTGFDTSRVATGVIGLDQLLRGGLTPNRLYLVEGFPGTGKTKALSEFQGVLTGVPHCVGVPDGLGHDVP